MFFYNTSSLAIFLFGLIVLPTSSAANNDSLLSSKEKQVKKTAPAITSITPLSSSKAQFKKYQRACYQQMRNSALSPLKNIDQAEINSSIPANDFIKIYKHYKLLLLHLLSKRAEQLILIGPEVTSKNSLLSYITNAPLLFIEKKLDKKNLRHVLSISHLDDPDILGDLTNPQHIGFFPKKYYRNIVIGGIDSTEIEASLLDQWISRLAAHGTLTLCAKELSENYMLKIEDQGLIEQVPLRLFLKRRGFGKVKISQGRVSAVLSHMPKAITPPIKNYFYPYIQPITSLINGSITGFIFLLQVIIIASQAYNIVFTKKRLWINRCYYYFFPPEQYTGSPFRLFQNLSARIKGQDQFLQEISSAIGENINANYLSSPLKGNKGNKALGILLIGPTGVGKTATIAEIGEITKIPIIYINATQLAPTSYKGGSINDALRPYYQSGEIGEKNTPFIIHIDEIDKIIRPKPKNMLRNNNDEHYKQLLTELLKLFEKEYSFDMRDPLTGDTHQKKLDFSNSIIIASGTFNEQKKYFKEQLNKLEVYRDDNQENIPEEELNLYTWPEKGKNFSDMQLEIVGMHQELIARFSMQVTMNSLSRKVLKEIIATSTSEYVIEINRLIYRIQQRYQEKEVAFSQQDKEEIKQHLMEQSNKIIDDVTDEAIEYRNARVISSSIREHLKTLLSLAGGFSGDLLQDDKPKKVISLPDRIYNQLVDFLPIEHQVNYLNEEEEEEEEEDPFLLNNQNILELQLEEDQPLINEQNNSILNPEEQPALSFEQEINPPFSTFKKEEINNSIFLNWFFGDGKKFSDFPASNENNTGEIIA